ncbi:hypothetical protein N7457_009746 [Penicillium paradoxum]|uniref:uncharacterized protein n=1 Tax=Penicillium paradoxum TaxID=176176 RepID=UPI0025489E22|nr:uncharacterized protein N7457_009746 [Penicillium paradoxum]KAJ5774850.1 hypothetical protein N7457_009746 [Penicillium paradoxum]
MNKLRLKKMKRKRIDAMIIQKVADASKDGVRQDTNPANELLNALASLQLDPRYSDLTIVCGDIEYDVHKCIVCTRSEFFAKACSSEFQKSSMHRIILQEHPALVKKMIEYFYTLDYKVEASYPEPAYEPEIEPTAWPAPAPAPAPAPEPEPTAWPVSEPEPTAWPVSEPEPTAWPVSEPEPEPEAEPEPAPEPEPMAEPPAWPEPVAEPAPASWPASDPEPEVEPVPEAQPEDCASQFDSLLFHISMYSLADRRLINGLKLLSKEKVELELSQRLNSEIFPIAISEIYNSTPEKDRGLRDLAVKMTMDNLVELRTQANAGYPTHYSSRTVPVAFPDSLVQSVPQFSSDLVLAMMDKTVSDWTRRIDRPNGGITRGSSFWQ